MAPGGRDALKYFVISAVSATLPFILTYFCYFQMIRDLIASIWIPWMALSTIGIQYYIWTQRKSILSKSLFYQFVWRSGLLGSFFGSGFVWSLYANGAWRPFGYYMIILSAFHFSEFMTTALINPRSLKIDSFLLNHSLEYGVAAIGSWLEFVIEVIWFPGLKDSGHFLSFIGILVCLVGEALRKLAMFTAGSNFNHVIQSRHVDGHVLITHGVYSLCRHPSYVGWFYWSIATQLILVNPVCLVAYALASWSFFKIRIEEEEVTLVNFFGKEYVDYKTCVPSGLPFINGADLPNGPFEPERDYNQ